MATTADIFRMSSAERMGEAMLRSLPLLPHEAVDVVKSMLQPATLAIMAGTLAVWAASHMIGIGEFVDIFFLTVGFVTLGGAVWSGAEELYKFVDRATTAQSDPDLDAAAKHFAEAVKLLGISTLQAFLMRAPTRAVIGRGKPQLYPMPNVGAPPPPGTLLRLSRPASLPRGDLGGTDFYGTIEISRAQSLIEQRISLYHELFHRYFMPKTGPLRGLRAQLRANAYWRSALLRYLEEGLAEGYGQLRVKGLADALQAYKFPISGPNPYVTISQLVVEGEALGAIMLGGILFRVSMADGSQPTRPDQ
jgi:hypothetical protein